MRRQSASFVGRPDENERDGGFREQKYIVCPSTHHRIGSEVRQQLRTVRSISGADHAYPLRMKSIKGVRSWRLSQPQHDDEAARDSVR